MLTWDLFLDGYGLPPAGALKLEKPLDPSDGDCADFSTLAIAQDIVLPQLAAAIAAAGLDGAVTLVDFIATTDPSLRMGMYKITPLAAPGDPAGVSVFGVQLELTASKDMTINSGDKTFTVPKGAPVTINEIMGNLFARSCVTLRPGQQVDLRNALDKNQVQRQGGTPYAYNETVATSLALAWSENSQNSIVPGGYYCQAYWVKP